jgi:hypothetical protein
MKRIIWILSFWLAAFLVPARAEPSARALLDKAQEYIATSAAIRRVDTMEQSTDLIFGENRVEVAHKKGVVTIEIDFRKHLVRQKAVHDGQELVMLKQGDQAAMKQGSGPWQIPTGLHARIAQDMGNLFVCEIETPETKEDAPNWRVVGTDVLDGDDAYVIETEGNTAVPLAQARMAKALAKAFAGDSANGPSVKVLEYSAKHWIRKSDYRHLQAVQSSKVELLIATPFGAQQVIEHSNTTSKYSYEQIAIDIPADALKLLSDNNPQLNKTEETRATPGVEEK